MEKGKGESVVSEAFAPILFQLGIGGIGGFFIGYAVRKVVKVALILGIVVFSLIFLAYRGVIDVNFVGLVGVFSKLNPALELFTPLLAHLPFVGSLIIGLVIGLKKK